MRTVSALVRRNNKIFFRDKGLFFTSLITPLILLTLYVTFLAKVYRDAFLSSIGENFVLDKALVEGLVGGQLVSSLLAVSCVTVAFCSNLLMVQDKAGGAYRDLSITPIKKSALSIAYFVSSASVTLVIAFTALFAGFIYLAVVGWYLSFTDVLLLIFDVVILVLFGTALSSIINCNLKSNGQASAVGSIVSSGYGFLCGAYMPISNFPLALRNVISFLPGTYGTSLLRNHALGGIYSEMQKQGIPSEFIEKIKDSTDCNLYFFGNSVNTGVSVLVLVLSTLLVLAGYVLICNKKRNKR